MRLLSPMPVPDSIAESLRSLAKIEFSEVDTCTDLETLFDMLTASMRAF
jgi:hypothetical protein